LTERPAQAVTDPAAGFAAGVAVRLLRAPRLASALILALAAAGLFAWVVLVGRPGGRGSAVLGPGISTLLVLVAALESLGVLAHTNPLLEAVVLGLAAASGHALYLLFSLLWPGGRQRAAQR
jgi:hypothetical protein